MFDSSHGTGVESSTRVCYTLSLVMERTSHSTEENNNKNFSLAPLALIQEFIHREEIISPTNPTMYQNNGYIGENQQWRPINDIF